MRRCLVIAALTAMLFVGALPAQAQSDQRCFPETGQCISGRIREFWEQNGGLPVFGFPIGSQQEMTIEGKLIQAQNFERNRLELHPENARPNDVLLGRLGADRLAQQGRDWFSFPKGTSQAGCRAFAETGHTVCGEILASWRASGLELDGRAGKTEAESLALFGMPLSGVMTETLGDGKEYQVQWFERARFELHPENQPPYNVLLGLLGNEVRDAVAVINTPPVQLVLRLEELPPGFTVESSSADNLEEVAQNYRDPAVALQEFQQQGRQSSYTTDYSREVSFDNLLAGPTYIMSQVILYRDSNGAKRAQEYIIADNIADGWQPISVRTIGDRTMALQRTFTEDDFEFVAYEVIVQRRNALSNIQILGFRAGTSVEEAFRLAEIAAKRLG